MKFSRPLLAALIFSLLAACGHQRPALNGNIAISAKRIPANLNEQMTGNGTARPVGMPAAPAPQPVQGARLSAFAQTVITARDRDMSTHAGICADLMQKDISGDAGKPLAKGYAIVLSGGGPHGTFGAGLFLGLQDKGQLPPEPEVVTGVSTGSLQSTFVFLARQPVAKDRDYSWINPKALPLHSLPGAGNQPPLVKGRSNLEDLALAYSIGREGEILKLGSLGDLSLITDGARAQLTPLRKRLFRMISPDTITQLATEACRGRVLLVGVTDVDDGNGYALDLTGLALKAFEGEASQTRMTLVRNTYVSALIASSSVPVGAMPVTLRYREFDDEDKPSDIASRQHMFIDGGARFGVFLPKGSDGSDLTLIVNTFLDTPPWTEGDPAIPTTKWKLIGLGLRTVNDLLETQIYNLSVGQVEAAAGKLSMAYLSNQNIVAPDGRPGENPVAHVYLGRTCGQWQSEVDALHHPLQFFPDYMACLIDYGRSRGNLAQWNLTKPELKHQ
ncbi:patatin-like phospholipase family protein [Novosphingobium sediminicola]|uniref:Putative acylesterase/phospholipase RssA n=1 Tax=Novosphingobium sediminicola TaxID=563162 RepID=A0A7W6G6G2_9SPHN|nr:patatin-like phospholipase family protein [Novosphingobium sediminicola]MBB3955749.1 putative acylesterase/phospholipase RssA [Novosphingobium sediminicola]